MKKITLLSFLVSLSLLVTAQIPAIYGHLAVTREGTPQVIVNGHIVVNLNNVIVKDIDSMQVFRGPEEVAPDLKNLTTYGIILIKLKKKVKIETRTFHDIQKSMRVKGKVRFAVDGFFIDDKSLLIETQSIAGIEVFKTRTATGDIMDIIINVWTLEPDQRKGYISPPHLENDKPGVIYIR